MHTLRNCDWVLEQRIGPEGSGFISFRAFVGDFSVTFAIQPDRCVATHLNGVKSLWTIFNSLFVLLRCCRLFEVSIATAYLSTNTGIVLSRVGGGQCSNQNSWFGPTVASRQLREICSQSEPYATFRNVCIALPLQNGCHESPLETQMAGCNTQRLSEMIQLRVKCDL